MADRKKNQAGFGLSELLVGISMMLILLFAIGSFLATCMRVNNKITIKNDYDRKAQLALTMITEELRYCQFNGVRLREPIGRDYYAELWHGETGKETKIFVEGGNTLVIQKNSDNWQLKGIRDVRFSRMSTQLFEVQVSPVEVRGEKAPVFTATIKPLNKSDQSEGGSKP